MEGLSSFRAIKNTVFGISLALLLGACVKPVNTELFLDDDSIEKIVGGNGGGFYLGFEENDKEYAPSVKPSGIITLSLSGSESKTIEITNYSDYDLIEWYCLYKGMTALSTANTYDVDVADSPFNNKGTYQISIRGRLNGREYSREVLVSVE